MRHGWLVYLALIGSLLCGLYLITNPYIAYRLYICVTENGHTTCHYETVRSYKFQILLIGVMGTITSLGNIIIYTIVTIIMERRKRRKRTTTDTINNS